MRSWTKAQYNEASKAYYWRNRDVQKDKARIRRRIKKYGVTDEQVDALFKMQGSVCAICAGEKPNSVRTWHVDHDHETKQVRGVLCPQCNVGLGNFKDAPALLEKAAQYLRDRRIVPPDMKETT